MVEAELGVTLTLMEANVDAEKKIANACNWVMNGVQKPQDTWNEQDILCTANPNPDPEPWGSIPEQHKKLS